MKKIILSFLFAILMFSSCSKENVEQSITHKAENTDKTITSTNTTGTTKTARTKNTNTTKLDLSGLAKSELSGLYIKEDIIERRPFAVMINNHNAALPQYGLEEADVIYETLAEGGITRLVAVFKDFDGDKIGPVRSARHYFLDFSFDHDAIYVHYGQSPQASQAFVNLNSPNLNGLSYLDNIMCFQDPDRVRPHSTFTSYEGLNAGLDAQGYRKTMQENFKHKLEFSDDINLSGLSANKVSLDFSYFQNTWFEYDKSLKKYKRFQFEDKQIDAVSGKQLICDNIIIQLVNMWNIPGDTEGRLDMELVGSGRGYYAYGGKYIPIIWEKDSHYEPTRYKLENGEDLKINPGKTWIEVYPVYRDMISFE